MSLLFSKCMNILWFSKARFVVALIGTCAITFNPGKDRTLARGIRPHMFYLEQWRNELFPCYS